MFTWLLLVYHFWYILTLLYISISIYLSIIKMSIVKGNMKPLKITISLKVKKYGWFSLTFNFSIDDSDVIIHWNHYNINFLFKVSIKYFVSIVFYITLIFIIYWQSEFYPILIINSKWLFYQFQFENFDISKGMFWHFSFRCNFRRY